MANNILERYGIKEVADVTFYEITSSGKPGAPVLYLDTLKVSTTEQTAEQAEARGGKGNAALIIWDYGKEITLNLEDALFSMKSMALIYGDVNGAEYSASRKLTRTFTKEMVDNKEIFPTTTSVILNGTTFAVGTLSYYDADGTSTTNTASYAYAVGEITVKGYEITIDANKFPGTYYITGDTYARSETTGKDEFFQFIIPKAKMGSEVTLTLEAEGDPTVFSMSLRVLRPKDGKMMKLVQYTA